MTHGDTGIDFSDCRKMIGQCKFRSKYLNWGECATFFASRDFFDKSTNRIVVRWKDLIIITRNTECKLSGNLRAKQDLFTDKQSQYPKIKQVEFKKRDDQ